MAGIVQAGKLAGKLWEAGKSFFKAGGKAVTAVVDKAAATGAKLDTKLGKAVAEAKTAKEAKSLERFNTVYGKHTFTPKGGTIIYNKANSVFYSTKGGTVTQRFVKEGNVIKDLKNGRTYTEQGFEAWYKGLQAGWKNSRTQAAEAVIKAAEAAGHTAKEGAASGKSFLEKARIAGKLGEKGTVKGWAAVKDVGRTSRSVLKFGAEHPIISLIAGSALLKHTTGYEGGAIGLLTNMLGSDEEAGLVHALKDNIFGVQRDAQGNKKDVAVVQSILDETLGNGTYDKIADGLDKAGNEVGNIYNNAKDLASRGGEELSGAYNNLKERMSSGYGNGFLYDDNGNPIGDPEASQMPQIGNGNASGGYNSMLNYVANGNVSKMDLASLLASSYLMFGKFGWMGKAASLLLGSSTLHKINDRRIPAQEQGGKQAAQATAQVLQPAEPEPEREYVHRYR